MESVPVSLERALTDVKLGQKNAVTLSQLRGIIKHGGFNSGVAEIEAVGTLTMKDGSVFLIVLGSREEFRLAEDGAHPAEIIGARAHANRSQGDSYVVVGRVESGHELKVRSIRTR